MCNTIGIVGLGFMGRSIASCLLWKGLNVVGFTRPEDGYEPARQSIAADIDDIIAHHAADPSLASQWPARYGEARQWSGLARCDFIIECVPENLELKRSTFVEIEKAIPPHIPLATNTSAFPITLLQQGLKHPDRFIGMHWCAPCQVNRFLEVIRGDQSGDAAMNAAVALAKKAGRDPGIVNKDIPGFIVNRIAYAIYREALYLMQEGVADAQTIDNVFTSVIGMWGSVMGPMRWMDLTGFTLYAQVMDRLFPTLDNSTRTPPIFKQLIASGAKGADPDTGGRGFYDYTPDETRRWHQLLVENGWNMYKLSQEYDKGFPDIET